jgi:hypothetical protein
MASVSGLDKREDPIKALREKFRHPDVRKD